MAEAMVLTVPNHHIEGCGAPPDLRAEGGYTSYFEGICGDQWIFTYAGGEATLRGGDIDWPRVVVVSPDGQTGIVLDHAEQLWLAACLMASGLISVIPREAPG